MKTFNTVLVFLIFGFLFFLIQQSGIIAFWGVRGNITLAFFIALLAVMRRSLLPLIAFAALLFFVFWESPFWIPAFLVLGAILVVSHLGARVLTGRVSLDFFLLAVFSSVFFSFGLATARWVAVHGFNFQGIIFPGAGTLFTELSLNLVLGGVFVFVMTRRSIRKFLT